MFRDKTEKVKIKYKDNKYFYYDSDGKLIKASGYSIHIDDYDYLTEKEKKKTKKFLKMLENGDVLKVPKCYVKFHTRNVEKYYYVGTEEEIAEGDWVLGKWERANNFKFIGSSGSCDGSGGHFFRANNINILACPYCDNKPILNRYHSNDIECVTGWKINCNSCGGLTTTKGESLDAIIKMWNKLVKNVDLIRK